MITPDDALMGIFGFKRVGHEMEDSKLIDLAAKAAGIVLAHGRNVTDIHPSSVHYLSAPYWEPLTYDGDALRLAVKLGLCVQPTCSDDYDRAYAAAYLFDDCGREALSVREPYEDEVSQLSATRRAIVRAAAAIGEQK